MFENQAGFKVAHFPEQHATKRAVFCSDPQVLNSAPEEAAASGLQGSVICRN